MKGTFLPPWVLQVFGLAIIAVFVVVKIQTGEESLPLVSVGVGLATAGSIDGITKRLTRAYKVEPPPKDKDGDL